MLINLLWSIPENVGWFMTGVLATVAAILCYMDVRLLVRMWVDRRNEALENEVLKADE